MSRLLYLHIFLLSIGCAVVLGCKKGNKAVGVCLHVYLERDFLSLEGIVYPSSRQDRRSRLQRLRRSHGSLLNANQGDLNSNDTDVELKNFSSPYRRYPPEGAPATFSVDAFGNRDWIEGPELEDQCLRLKGVITCFEKVLMECYTSYEFFRYRHLLYALSKTHTFVCETPDYRKDKFLSFLKTIDCAERARTTEISCERHNVSSVVWNQILRVEIGEEICHSLSTQRACLLEHDYIKKHCNNPKQEEIYEDLSHYFLSIWCRLPMNPKFIMASSGHISSALGILKMVLFVLIYINLYIL